MILLPNNITDNVFVQWLNRVRSLCVLVTAVTGWFDQFQQVAIGYLVEKNPITVQKTINYIGERDSQECKGDWCYNKKVSESRSIRSGHDFTMRSWQPGAGFERKY